MEQRRTDPRHENRVPIEWTHKGASYSSHTRNLSFGGVFIETDQKFSIGDTVTLKFTIPTQKEAIEVAGVVRWVENEKGKMCGMGLHFQGLRAKDAYALGKLFEKG